MIVDDFSRFTWVLFLIRKSETCSQFSKFCRRVQNEKGYMISKIRNDHGEEFEIMNLKNFVILMGMNIIFPHLEPHNKMELLKEKIEF